MVLREQIYSIQDFEAYITQHPERLFELIHGEIVEKVPTEEHGTIVLNIGAEIRAYLKKNRIGRVTTEARHRPSGDVYNDRLPDVSFRLTQDEVVKQGAVEEMPDLAIEVKSPTDAYKQMREKADFYLANGSRMVWLIYPEKQTVELYQTGQAMQSYSEADALDGGTVLPNFTLSLREIFET
jgi:Uma2 family endonuclease